MKVFMCVADVHVHMPLLADAGLHLGIAGQGSFFAQISSNVILTVLVWLRPGCWASFSEKHYVHVPEGLCNVISHALAGWTQGSKHTKRRTKFRSVRSYFDFWMYFVKALNYLDVGLQLFAKGFWWRDWAIWFLTPSPMTCRAFKFTKHWLAPAFFLQTVYCCGSQCFLDVSALAGVLCLPLWSCVSLVSALVSQLVHLGWDAVSASLVLLFPVLSPICFVCVSGLVLFLSPVLSPSLSLPILSPNIENLSRSELLHKLTCMP